VSAKQLRVPDAQAKEHSDHEWEGNLCTKRTSHRIDSDVWLVPSAVGGEQAAGGTAAVRPSPTGLQLLRPASFSARTRNLQGEWGRQAQVGVRVSITN